VRMSEELDGESVRRTAGVCSTPNDKEDCPTGRVNLNPKRLKLNESLNQEPQPDRLNFEMGEELETWEGFKNYSGAATKYSGAAKIVPKAYMDTLLNKVHDSRKEDADTLLEKVNVFGAGLKLRGSSLTIESNTPENKKEAPTRRTFANPLVAVNGNSESQKEKEVKGPTFLFDEDYDDDMLPPFKREAPTHRPVLNLKEDSAADKKEALTNAELAEANGVSASPNAEEAEVTTGLFERKRKRCRVPPFRK
jgi:hypothetical protein